MNHGAKALEQGRTAIARQKEREEADMSIGVGEGARITRAEQVVLDMTHHPLKDRALIQAAIDAEVNEAVATARQLEVSKHEAFEAGKAEAEKRLVSQIEDLGAQVDDLIEKLARADKERGGLATEVGGKAKGIREAEGIMLGQEDIIKGLRDEVEALKSAVALLKGSVPEVPVETGVGAASGPAAASGGEAPQESTAPVTGGPQPPAHPAPPEASGRFHEPEPTPEPTTTTPRGQRKK